MRTPRQHAHTGSGRPVRRAAGLVVLAGLATGGAFAIGTGISSAAGGTATTPAAAPTSAGSAPSAAGPTASTPSTTTPPTGSTGTGCGWGGPGAMGRGMWGHGHGFGGGGFGGGGGGTITAVTPTTLTLRTEQGTETVTTTSSTAYTRERLTVGRGQLRVGEVVRVAGSRPRSAMTAPGTGAVTATRVEVVLPALAGRVASISGGTYTLVGPDGQLLTITSTASTRYYSEATAGTAAAVKVGTFVRAEGAQDSVTHLVADLIAVAPARGAQMDAPDGAGGPAAGSTASSGSDAAGASDPGVALTDAAAGVSA